MIINHHTKNDKQVHTSVTHLHEQRQAWRKYIDKAGMFLEWVVALLKREKKVLNDLNLSHTERTERVEIYLNQLWK